MSTSTFDWDKYALSYDSLLALTPYQKLLGAVAEKSAKGKSGPRLDASCGTGNLPWTEARHTTFPQPLVGIDGSPAMLNRAKAKCADLPYCSFFQANLDSPLPFYSGEFAQVISVNTIYAVSDPFFTLCEFRRVLQPGGELILVNPNDGFENGFILKEHAGSLKPDSYWQDAHNNPAREEMLLREALSDEETIQEMLCVAYHNRLIAQSQQFHFFNQCELEKILNQAGFEIQSVEMAYAAQDFLVVAK